MQKFIESDGAIYRPILNRIQYKFEEIDPEASDDEIDRQLYEAYHKLQVELREEGQQLLRCPEASDEELEQFEARLDAALPQMSTPDQPIRAPARFEAQSSHVTRRPDEILATLSGVEFQVLRDGEVNQARAGRDLCLGFLGSAAIGFIGLIATVDWDAAFHQARKGPFIWTALLFAIILSSACGALIYHRRYGRTSSSSAYADLMKRLANHFPK